jgi:hypothetical protein
MKAFLLFVSAAAAGVSLLFVSSLRAADQVPPSGPEAVTSAQPAPSSDARKPVRPIVDNEPKVVFHTDKPFADEPPTKSRKVDPFAVMDKDQLQWYQKIHDLATGPLSSPTMKEFREGEDQLLEIRDAKALEPMAVALYTSNTRWRSSFLKAVEQYAKTGQEPAKSLAAYYLSDMAVADSSSVLRGKARAALLSKETPHVTDRLKFQLANSTDNDERTRAANLLTDLRDESAIAGMIEMLTTTEVRVVGADIESRHVQLDLRPTWAGPASFTTVAVQAAVPGAFTIATTSIMLPNVHVVSLRTTVSAPGGIFVDPDIQQIEVTHPGILTALKRLTGKDFGYDKAAWHDWLRSSRGERQSQRDTGGVDWSKP